MSIDFDYVCKILDDIDSILKDEYTSLNSFWNPSQDGFTIRDPNSDSFNITSTCFALCELLQSDEMLTKFIGDRTNYTDDSSTHKEQDTILKRLCSKLKNSPWKTEDLPENNLYTASAVIKTLSKMNCALDSEKVLTCIQEMSNRLRNEGSMSLTDYPPHAYLTLQSMDAISSYLVTHADETEMHNAALDKGAEWAANELFAQISYYVSEDFDKSDIAHMIYCLIIYDKYGNSIGRNRKIIEKGLEIAFSSRLPSGLWPQGRPILHYGTRGDHYPFSFSLIDGLLSLKACPTYEYAKYIDALAPFVTWAQINAKSKQFAPNQTVGWPSNFKPMREEPECWSTVAVFSALRSIKNVIQAIVNQEVMKEFHSTSTAISPTTELIRDDPFNSILDSTVIIGESSFSFKNIINEYFIEPRISKQSAVTKRKNSALIFGPAGLTKSTWAEVIAKKLEWPLLYLHISDFISPNIASAAPRIQYIFSRLQRLRNVVVLLDDIEELVRRRDDAALTAESRILTTTMLPLLQRLHKNPQVILIATTNYQKEFDPPATRGERFDLILRATPPTEEEKMRYIHKRVQDNLSKEDSSNVSKILETIQEDRRFKEEMEYFTYQEWKAFVDDVIELAQEPIAVTDTNIMNQFQKVCDTLTIRHNIRDDFLESEKLSAIQS